MKEAAGIEVVNFEKNVGNIVALKEHTLSHSQLYVFHNQSSARMKLTRRMEKRGRIMGKYYTRGRRGLKDVCDQLKQLGKVLCMS